MIQSNENILSKLCVKVHSKDSGETGTGFILKQSQSTNKIYILTTKHCICGNDFNYPLNISAMSIEFNFNGRFLKYPLEKRDQILLNDENEPDIAIIIVDQNHIESLIGEVPVISAITDHKGIRNCVISGYPREFKLNKCKTINCSFDTTAEVSKLELSPQSNIETIEFDDKLYSIQGMSGGPVVIENDKQLYLYGIIDLFGGWERFTGSTVIAFNELLSKNDDENIQYSELELDAEIVLGIAKLNLITEEEFNRLHLKNRIGSVHFERDKIVGEAVNFLDESKLLIVNGSGGAGKSVISQKILNKQQNIKSIFIFRSDELLQGTLSGFLNKRGITKSLNEILNSPILLTEKLIYIDGAENLLEAHNFDAIETIFNIISQRNDSKVILSIRSKYVERLGSVLGSIMPEKKSFIDVPLLFEDEIQEVINEYNWIKQLYQNPKLKEILRVPFYLNHTISLSNVILEEGEINKRGLIIKLWKGIIVSNNPYRENAFQELVVQRAKAMKPYIKPSFIENTSDLIAALAELNQDEVVLGNEDNYGDLEYAPAHDIFQDWALIKYVNKLKETFPTLSDFLHELGSQLAIRKGFKLWITDQIELEKFDEINNEFIDGLDDETDHFLFWKDEIILAILRSENLELFIHACKDELLNNDALLFKRFSNLLLISTPERDLIENIKETNFFVDEEIENAWRVIINFLHENIELIQPNNNWILSFLKKWKNRAKLKLEKVDSNEALNNLCKAFMLKSDKSIGHNNKSNRKLLLDAYIKSSTIDSKELESLIEFAIDYEVGINDYRYRTRYNRETIDPPKSKHELFHYFKDILNKMKSGIGSEALCFLFPEKVIEYNFNAWKKDKRHDDSTEMFSYADTSIESEFGLSPKVEYNYFLASPYQTPIFNLLQSYTLKTIKEICLFFNDVSKKYFKNKSHLRSDDTTKVTIINIDGNPKELDGSGLLWAVFRGTVQVSPYLLQSILMALEKYLLDLSAKKDESSKTLLDRCLEAIYENSSNVSTIAVVSSLAMAHKQPTLIKKYILPLFTAPEFFSWDIPRYNGGRTPLAPMGDHPIIQKERFESNQLPHRKEYLEQFLIRLSLTTIMVEDILKIIDYHYNNRIFDNDTWSLMLNRMDRRKFEFIDEIETKGQIEIRPKLDKSLEETVKKNELEISAMTVKIGAMNWVTGIISENDLSNNSYDNWKEYFEQNQKNRSIGGMFDASSGIAHIGLKYHLSKLTDKIIQECIQIILNSAEIILKDSGLGEPYLHSGSFEIEPTLSALVTITNLQPKTMQVKTTLVRGILALNIDSGIENPLFQKLANEIWRINPEFAGVVLNTLLNFKSIDQTKPEITYQNKRKDAKNIKAYAKKISNFLKLAITNKLNSVNILESPINFGDMTYYRRAFLFIPNEVRLTDKPLTFTQDYTSLIQYLPA